MKRTPLAATVLAAMIATVPLFAGCTDVQRALNKGGDTRCSDYVQQNSDSKRITITKYVKQRTNDAHEPAGTLVDASMVAVNFLCQNQRNADTPIKNADLTGIFLNK